MIAVYAVDINLGLWMDFSLKALQVAIPQCKMILFTRKTPTRIVYFSSAKVLALKYTKRGLSKAKVLKMQNGL